MNDLPRVQHELPDEEYRRKSGASQTVLKEIALRSPAHAHELMAGERDPTPNMVDGSAVHCGVLEPELFTKRYHWSNARANTKAWREEQEENPERCLLTAERYHRVSGMINAVLEHPVARSLLDKGDPELSFFWKHYDIKCKGRADYVRRDGVVSELKSTTDASPRGFSRTVANFGYHLQSAFYTDGLRACDMPVRAFVFIAVESKPPHAVGVYTLDDKALHIGRAMYEKAISKYSLCVHLGRWPGYSEQIEELTLPRYAQ